MTVFARPTFPHDTLNIQCTVDAIGIGSTRVSVWVIYDVSVSTRVATSPIPNSPLELPPVKAIMYQRPTSIVDTLAHHHLIVLLTQPNIFPLIHALLQRFERLMSLIPCCWKIVYKHGLKHL